MDTNKNQLSSLDADTWLHIATHLTREGLDVLWRCNDMRLRALVQRIERAPPMVIHYKHQKWPAWLAHCKQLTNLTVRTPTLMRYMKSKSLNVDDVADRVLGDVKWRPAFWHNAMSTWSPNTLKSLTLHFSSTAAKTFWLACKGDDSQAMNAPSEEECASPQGTPSVLDMLRLAFPRLTSLQLTATRPLTPEQRQAASATIDSTLCLSDWILSNHSLPTHQDDDSRLATPLHTLHLNGLAEYQPETPQLIRYLPRTLVDLQLSFYGAIQDDDTRPTLPPQSYVMWDEHTVILPPYLTRLSLGGVSPYLLQPNVLATLQHLEHLQLIFGNYYLDDVLQLEFMQSLHSPLSQLPLTVHTLEMSDMHYDRMLAHVAQIPSNNRLTSLTVREIGKGHGMLDMREFKRLIEYLVSSVKFRQLEMLHVWPAFYFMSNHPHAVPSLSGMESMRRLQSISAFFLDPVLRHQWRKHLPLPINDSDPPLRVVTNDIHGNGANRLVNIGHYYAEQEELICEVLPKLHFEAVNWRTSRPDVQLPPRLASSIHTVMMESDAFRNDWLFAAGLTVDDQQPLSSSSSSSSLNWAQSIQHLTNVETLYLEHDHNMSYLRELTCCSLKTLNVRSSRLNLLPFPSSVFDFSQPWASRLVHFSVQVDIQLATSVTHFTKLLPSTLEVLDLKLVCEGDPAVIGMNNAIYAKRFKDYATVSQEERSKRELCYLPPHLRVCRIYRSNIYMTDTTLRCLPKSLVTMQILHILDAHFDPRTLLELPPNLSMCLVTSVFCSDPRLKDTAAVRTTIAKVWKRLPAPRRLRFELPVQSNEM